MIHPAIVAAARIGVEKQAASLGELAARGGAAIGTALGGRTVDVARFAPAALGALGGAYVGSMRPDVGGDQQLTRGQKIRGALAGGLAGAGLAQMTGLGSTMAAGLADRARRTGLHGDQAIVEAMRNMGRSAGKSVASIPGRVGQSIAGAGRTVADTVMNPVRSAKDIVSGGASPIYRAVTQPGTVGQHLMREATNPVGAVFLGLSGLDAARNMAMTEDPMTGRRRGFGERALGSAATLGTGLAYGAHGATAPGNALTRFIGQTAGSIAAREGASALGRQLDKLRPSQPQPLSSQGQEEGPA